MSNTFYNQAILKLKTEEFISLERGSKIIIEHEYFNTFIENDSFVDYFSKIDEYFPSLEDKNKVGLGLSLDNYNEILLREENYDEFKVILERMRQDNIQKNETTYKILIDRNTFKSKDYTHKKY